MDTQAQSETIFSPRRWFLGDDGRVRPLWRSFLFIVLTVGIYLLLAWGAHTIELRKRGPELMFAAFDGLAVVLLLLASWLLLTVLDQRPFRALGLWFYSEAGQEFWKGFAVGGALMGAGVLTMVVAGSLTYYGFSGQPQVTSVVLWGGILLLASAVEEIAFRGYGMQRLMESAGESTGVLVFSALFALAHMGNPGSSKLSVVNTFLAGLLLSLAYVKTRALWLPIGLHFSWNFLMGQIFSLPVSGWNFGPRLFRAEVSGPEWLTGGSYGPEGSALMTVLILLGVIWMGQTRWISPSPAVEEGLE